jgi:hypothetical protein
VVVPLFFAGGFCESALPAADLLALPVLLLFKVFDAADAAGFEVSFFGAFRCDRVLPAALFDFAPVFLLRRVFEALDAAFLPVTRLLAMSASSVRYTSILAKGSDSIVWLATGVDPLMHSSA